MALVEDVVIEILFRREWEEGCTPSGAKVDECQLYISR
jgi:hypothetical protein